MIPELVRGGYRLEGQTLPRVSSILALMAKPGLEGWHRKVGFEEADKTSAAAIDYGTRLHAATAVLDQHGALTAEPDLLPALSAYSAWSREYVARVLAVERVVWHPELRYAGTLDRLYRLHDGRLVLADLKTGKTVDGLTRAQLAAYALALAETDGIHVDGRLVIHLPRERPYVCRIVEYDDLDTDTTAWQYLVALYWWWQKHRDDWKQNG